MTWYPRSAYGSTNPNAGYPANGDFAAWGGYKWPDGVPASLLATAVYTSGTNGQTARILMRKELVPLWQLVLEIQDRKWHYPVWVRANNGEAWGPWGYANRPVAGTQRASGHSGALSTDENAPNNPYSGTFQSDMPPGMVADMESLGLYWGGRYTGQKYDPMHYGFCRAPSTVAGYIDKARKILGHPSAPIPPEVDMPLTDADKKWITQAFADAQKQFWSVDTVQMNGDEMSTPPDYPITRDGMLERGTRLTSIGSARVTGRDGKYAVTKVGGGK
jgi:hypothetical protein